MVGGFYKLLTKIPTNELRRVVGKLFLYSKMCLDGI